MENTSEYTNGFAKETANSKSDTNKKLIENIKIENTPFHAIKADDKWFLTMGKYRLTNQLDSLEECKEAAMDASWDRLMQVIQIMIEENNATETKKPVSMRNG